ncbi:hypothetical protein GCM10029963_21920 [Micromonospora andamanensis]
MSGRFPIEDVSPVVSCGRYPARAVVGELVPVSARAYREGHDALGCNVVWLGPDGLARPFTRMRPGEPGQDRWHAMIVPDAVGEWMFTVEAFSDPYLTWHNAVTKKIAAGQGPAELANDLAEGVRVLSAATKLVPKAERARLKKAAQTLGDAKRQLPQRVSPALELAELLWEHPVRELVTTGDEYRLWVDRERALFSAWYEFFPARRGRSRRLSTRRPAPAPSPPPPSGCRVWPPWVSMCSTCRRSTRSVGSTARARTTAWSPGRTTWVRRGRSARPRAGTTPSTPIWVRLRTSGTSSPPPPKRAWRWRWTWRCSAPRITRG